MSVRQFLGSIRWGAISAVSRREVHVHGPIVSFTFDDFPQSALHLGGAILKKYGASGTFYASVGLMDTVNGLGLHFSADDLQSLLRDGHELGSHTFSHLSCRSTSLRSFEANAIRGKEAVERVTGTRDAHQFSYPYGHVTLLAKKKIGAGVSSCRGIVPGINKSPVDLNLLRANRLYSWSFDLGSIDQLLRANEQNRGWVIFYTHDISDNPSRFGCRPSEFESVVKLTVETRASILSVGQAISSSLTLSAAPGGLSGGYNKLRVGRQKLI
jgi:peptidoglycan/xylan/chitin deacetylase (PgdA/CDA1 family)